MFCWQGMQKALEYFWYLENYAQSHCWTGADRSAYFYGQPLEATSTLPHWPRIFILTQYSAQARLVMALLDTHPCVTPLVRSNIVVRAPSCPQQAPLVLA
jgi:hypothetical protein